MHAMRAETFSGYEGLKLVDLPKPAVTDGKVLVRITAAGVTPLDHTILSGKFPHPLKAPLVLGNEGAGVVEEGGGTDFPVGSRVMFFGAYGAFEDGTYSEWVAVQKKDLCLIPDNVDDVSAAGIPVGYGADIVIDGIGGEVLSEALGALALEGRLITLGYSASRKTTIDVTNLIVPQASIRGFNMFAQPQAAVTDAWNVIVSLLRSGAIKPIVAKTFPLAEAAAALR